MTKSNTRQCGACGDVCLLPDWTNGLCFICISDGRTSAGTYEPTGGDVGELCDARLEGLPELEEGTLAWEIAELFIEAQQRSGRRFDEERFGGVPDGWATVSHPDSEVGRSVWARPVRVRKRMYEARGRPLEVPKERAVDIILASLREGHGKAQAVALGRVSYGTFLRWLRNEGDLRARVASALASRPAVATAAPVAPKHVTPVRHRESRAARTLIRYPNRKLYDPVEVRYINLTRLAELVADGIQWRVVAHGTGEDLTERFSAQLKNHECA